MVLDSESARETPPLATGDKKLSDYELVTIITPEATDAGLEARLQSISQFVESHGGAVSSIDRWGKRRTTYPIKRFTEGSYVLYRLKLPPAASREIEANLRITEDVLRHLLIKVESKEH